MKHMEKRGYISKATNHSMIRGNPIRKRKVLKYRKMVKFMMGDSM